MARSRTGGIFLFLFALLLIGFVWVVVGPEISRVAAQQTVRVSQHALDGHVEAALIETCLNKNGSYMNFRDLKEKDKYYKTCQLPDGRWGLAPFIKNGNKLYNKTAFVPKGGTWKELLDYLWNKATRFNGSLP